MTCTDCGEPCRCSSPDGFPHAIPEPAPREPLRRVPPAPWRSITPAMVADAKQATPDRLAIELPRALTHQERKIVTRVLERHARQLVAGWEANRGPTGRCAASDDTTEESA